MSERLTDAELDDVTARVIDGKCHICGSLPSPIIGCSACDGTGQFALSTETMVNVLTELRSRRALDLTAREVAALRVGRICLLDSVRRSIGHPNALDLCVEVLDRLSRGAK